VRDHLAVDRGVVVLDLDDTLTDWWTAIGRAAVEVADDEVAEVLHDVVRREAWIRRDDGAVHREHWRLRVEPLTFWRSVFPHSEVRASDIAARFAERLRVQLYEDVLPTLSLLSSDTELGLLSNSPFAEQELAALGIASHFSTVISVTDPIRKPHPEAFRRLLVAIEAEPGDVLYVGDSPISDIEPARDQGMRSVWLDRFHDPWSPPSDVQRLQTLDELPGLLHKE
jgi:HAD superfamily hydrolase (TIGR01509 family)